MTMTRLFRSELRKITTTKMPWAFLAVLVVLAGLNAFAVIAGTDFDGSKGFISTEVDQQSLMAFAANALAIAGLFGAIAVAREYGHHTVVPTFLAEPRRHRAVLAQLGAIAVSGGVLGLLGAGLTVASVAVSLPATDYGFLVSTGNVIHVLGASAFAGAVGAVLGWGSVHSCATSGEPSPERSSRCSSHHRSSGSSRPTAHRGCPVFSLRSSRASARK